MQILRDEPASDDHFPQRARHRRCPAVDPFRRPNALPSSRALARFRYERLQAAAFIEFKTPHYSKIAVVDRCRLSGISLSRCKGIQGAFFEIRDSESCHYAPRGTTLPPGSQSLSGLKSPDRDMLTVECLRALGPARSPRTAGLALARRRTVSAEGDNKATTKRLGDCATECPPVFRATAVKSGAGARATRAIWPPPEPRRRPRPRQSRCGTAFQSARGGGRHDR